MGDVTIVKPPAGGVEVLLDPEVFDPVFYAATYPDLAAAGLTTVQQLQDHWLVHGAQEGRRGSAAFDAVAYLRRNPQALQLSCYGILSLATQHFVRRGRTLGWSGAPGCNCT